MNLRHDITDTGQQTSEGTAAPPSGIDAWFADATSMVSSIFSSFWIFLIVGLIVAAIVVYYFFL